MIVHFMRPVFLFYLLFIPFLILVHLVSLRLRKKKALKFANFDAISKIKGIDLLSKNIGILLLSMLIILLMTLSLAGMEIQRTLPASSFSFAIAIDTSRSMEAADFTPNRLESAKATASEFIDITPPSTKFSVLSFSGNAFIEQALTADKTSAKSAVKNIQLSSIGGTDLEEAVITSSNLLEAEPAKVLILLSDGRINVGTIDEAVKYANNNEVIVHTIGIGTTEGGETTYGMSKLDEDSLKALAFNTGGEYFQAENPQQLQSAFNTILELKTKKVFIDISSYLLIIAIILLALDFILMNTRLTLFP